MKIGIMQFQPFFKDIPANHKKIYSMLSRRRFDLMILPELATTGYNFIDRTELETVAERRGGPSYDLFADLAGRAGGAIIWGTAEKVKNKIFNSAVLTLPDGKHRVYRKTHLFFREKLYFDPGDTGFKVFAVNGVKVGIMICYDWIYPEASRALMLRGAQVIAHPSNLVMTYCQDAMITRSLENGLFTATTNRVGMETNSELSLTFTGQSQVTSPRGERLLAFGRKEESVKTVKIRPQDSDIKSINRLNNLTGDRRVEYYAL